MKKILSALFPVLLIVAGAIAGPYDAWSNYRTITINTTAAGGGANVTSAQANFPVLVRLTDASSATGSDVLAGSLSGGADVRFTNSTGQTALSFEIERWSASAAEVWVRVPSVAASSQTVIRVYWGNGAATAASSSTAVFGSNDFLGVWHMGNTSGATARPNAVNPGTNDATPAGPATAGLTPKTGAIGLADSLRSQATGGTSSNGDHFSIGSLTYPNQAVTNSMWMYYPSNQAFASGFVHFMSIGNASSSHVLWFGREGSVNFRTRGAGGTGAGTTGETDQPESTTVASAITSDAWMQLAVSRDSTNGRRWNIYKNGVLVRRFFRGTATGTNSAERHTFAAVSRSTTFLGRSIGWPDRTSQIMVDEARISSVARSPDWMKLEYETQKPGATALTLGTSTPNTPRRLEYTFKNAVYAHQLAITNNDPILNGAFGTPTGYSVSPALPNGLSLNTTTGVISGTPNGVSATANYIVTATFADSVGMDTLTIKVNPAAPTALSYPTTTAIYGVGTPIATNTPTVNSLSDPNFKVDTFTVSPTLPAGLAMDPTTGVISGTPSVASAATAYTVTASNGTGSSTQVLTFTVLAAPTGLSYSQDPASYEGGLPISANIPTVTGTVQTWSVQSGSLPAGLTLDTLGRIKGTPTAAFTGSVTIRAANVAGFVDEAVDITVTTPEDYTTWTNLKTMYLNTNAAAAGTSEAVALFPVLVRLTSAHAAIFAAAKGDGRDVRFSLADGTRLAYDIDRWDSAGQKAEVWVQVPSVTAGGITPIRIHYGNASAVTKSGPERVFGAANGYVAVWHLGNAPGIDPRPNAVAGAPTAKPSNNFAGAEFGGGAGTYVAKEGAIGKADTVRGGGNRNTPTALSDYLNVGDAADNTSSPYSGNNTYKGYSDFSVGYTYTVWVMAGAQANFTYLASLANTTGASDNIQVFRPDGNVQRVRFEQINVGSSGGLITTTGPDSLKNAQWRHVGVTSTPSGSASSNAIAIYVNGVLAGSGNATQRPRVVTRTNAWIGKSNYTGDAYFAGSYDEPRYANVARSANWVKLEYKNQKPGTTPVFDLSYATPAPTYQQGTPITANTATVLGGVTRFEATNLPAGLAINASTGAITGTPTAGGVYSTVVTAFGDSAWSTPSTLSITVEAPPTIAYADTITYSTNVAVNTTPSSTGGAVVSYAVNPALPAGLAFNTTTGAITGTATSASAAATYTVVATNTIGTDTATFVLIVNESAPSITYPTPVSYVANTAIDTLSPTSTGGAITAYSALDPLPTGLSLNATNGKITGTPTVTAAAADYRIVATGNGGMDTVTINITINAAITVPGKPTGVVGTAGAGQVSVAFTAPSNNGGAAITGYTVTASPGGATATGASSPLVVTGLTNGTAYVFTVKATNSAGQSAASDTSAAVTPRTVPGTPTAVAGTAGNAQVTVTWTAPVSNGGSVITAYTVTAAPGGATCGWTTGPLSCVVTGLTNGTSYTFTVTATNVAGTGSASAASAAVTPRTVPGAPTALGGTAGNGQATMTWTAPASNGGSVITSYVVRGTGADSTKTCTWTTGPLTCTVTGLTNGTPYTFTVVAVNVAGAGAASTPSTALTPVGILFGSQVIRVTSAQNAFRFAIPAAAVAGTEQITMTISDLYGRTVWTHAMRPDSKNREITWNGRTTSGRQASAGMYIVHLDVLVDGKSTRAVDKGVTLKPR